MILENISVKLFNVGVENSKPALEKSKCGKVQGKKKKANTIKAKM